MEIAIHVLILHQFNYFTHILIISKTGIDCHFAGICQMCCTVEISSWRAAMFLYNDPHLFSTSKTARCMPAKKKYTFSYIRSYVLLVMAMSSIPINGREIIGKTKVVCMQYVWNVFILYLNMAA